MTLPGLKSAAELGARKPHGHRIKYMGGCRCLKCRMANAAAATRSARLRRQGLGNPIVDATTAAAHMRALSEIGFGRRRVSRATGIAMSTLHIIRNGSKPRIRRATELKILAVTVGVHTKQGNQTDERPPLAQTRRRELRNLRNPSTGVSNG